MKPPGLVSTRFPLDSSQILKNNGNNNQCQLQLTLVGIQVKHNDTNWVRYSFLGCISINNAVKKLLRAQCIYHHSLYTPNETQETHCKTRPNTYPKQREKTTFATNACQIIAM
ncbi:hypothetical protein CIPAW_16G012400 [Carya illinoinensis]|uniref:Uncharacterized protein n=1 Tax=Carya illinoinensis TaxID=32201 RepID=A0A8T1N1G0_CARIL|nr:hypothetical protein CIPAW_16G012400 [Carya illinoinensis]